SCLFDHAGLAAVQRLTAVALAWRPLATEENELANSESFFDAVFPATRLPPPQGAVGASMAGCNRVALT
ncbi:MAG: hypothetical protein ACRDXX_04710, partial [Stackebrandtia sp.]